MEIKGLVMIGGVLVGGFFALATLKDAKIEALLNTGVVSLGSRPLDHASQTRGEGAAADYVIARSWAQIAEGPVATHDRSTAVFIGDAIPDWRPASKREVVGKVQLLLNRSDCAMRPPAAGARLVNLRVEHPATKSGLYSFSEAELVDGVRDWFKNIRYDDSRAVPGPKASHEFRVHDIAVTDTDELLHLVLQNPNPGNLVYNFHLAPGVEIAGVTMLGGDANAVANLPEGVPVEVADAATMTACGVPIRDEVRMNNAIEKRIGDRQLSRDDEIAEARAAAKVAVAAFETWFSAQFGAGSAASRIGLSYAEVSLIGPVREIPETAGVTYRPLTGAYVVAQTEKYLKVAGLHEWPEAYRGELERLATDLAGGDPRQIVLPKHNLRDW